MRVFIAMGEESNRSFLFSFLECFLQKIPFHVKLNIQKNIPKKLHTHETKQNKGKRVFFYLFE